MTLGHWAIDKECVDKIREILPIEGSVILELGSGAGTAVLAEYYTMYSIEHNKKWLNKYPSTYIYAPVKKIPDTEIVWYDPSFLQDLPRRYDMILVDGPPGNLSKNSRDGFRVHSHIFNMNVPIIYDDVHRSAEKKQVIALCKELGKRYKTFHSGEGVKRKSFAVIY